MKASRKLKAAVNQCEGLDAHDKCALASVLLANVMDSAGSDTIGFAHSITDGSHTCVAAMRATTTEQMKRFDEAIESLSIIEPGDKLLSLDAGAAKRFMRDI
jgi:SUMO ligase MMS21 Smc5/6 complex component